MTLLSPQTWVLGAKSLMLHPMRSLLTVLGIFIGTASVIWLLAIGEGISRKAQEQIAGLGADNIIVRSVKPPGDVTSSSSFSSMFVTYGVTREDYQQLLKTVPTIDRVLRIRELRRRFTFGSRELDGRLVGCEPSYAQALALNLHRGRFLNDSDVDRVENVCVLAAGTAAKLFPAEDPVGQVVRVENDVYLIVGVMAPRMAQAGIGGSLAAQEFDQDVYIPVTTLWSRIGDRIFTRRSGSMEGEIVELSQLTLHIRSMDDVMETADIIRSTLRRNHRIEDYAVVVPLQLLEQAKTTRMMFMLFMGLIAAISLVVGGIGIMNIMLATVTERTKEIGIRRALGARRQDITRQFLVETTVLSVMGGATGVLGGIACGPLTDWVRGMVQSAYPELTRDLPPLVQSLTPVLVPWSIPLAFSISVGVGLIFGLYPALRASHMDPINALRHE